MSMLESSNEVNDNWFKDGFKTWKNPIPVPYEIMAEPGEVQTLEGPIKYESGDYMMTGPNGEKYPITPEKFASLYDSSSNEQAIPRKIEKIAKMADHNGVLHIKRGDLHYTAGNDYIVRHGAGDYGAVKKDVFAKTYHLP